MAARTPFARNFAVALLAVLALASGAHAACAGQVIVANLEEATSQLGQLLYNMGFYSGSAKSLCTYPEAVQRFWSSQSMDVLSIQRLLVGLAGCIQGSGAPCNPSAFVSITGLSQQISTRIETISVTIQQQCRSGMGDFVYGFNDNFATAMAAAHKLNGC